jgi:hypothetical protein
MADVPFVATVPQSQNRATKGKECQYSPLFLQKPEWLPWKSDGLEHGLIAHKVTPGGFVAEVGDRSTEPRRKSKAISSRQWEGR